MLFLAIPLIISPRTNKMKAPSPSLALKILLLHTLLLSVSPPPTQCSDDDLIEQICKKTPFYDLCIGSLGSGSSGSSSNTDVKGLASTIAGLILSNATDTLDYIQELVKEAGPDPKLERPLAYCAEVYIPVVKYNLPQAIDALSKGRFGFAKYVIADAAKQADACEKNFSGENKSPLTERNRLVSNLCGIAVAILNLLANF